MELVIEFGANVIIWLCLKLSFNLVRRLFKRFNEDKIYVSAIHKSEIIDNERPTIGSGKDIRRT